MLECGKVVQQVYVLNNLDVELASMWANFLVFFVFLYI